MAQIINTATITEYQYPVGSTPKVVDDPLSSTAINELTDVVINFDKVCTPHNADINDLITIQYTASNSTQAATPIFDSINVQDDILISNPTNVQLVGQSNTTNYDSTAGTFDIDLSPLGGTLAPGDTITATVSFRVIPGADLTLNYNTTATAIFTENTTRTRNNLSDTCNLQINNATLTIEKTSSIPATTPITCGQTLTYSIVITNTGNVNATILEGNFSDPLPPDTTYAGSISPSTFGFNGTAVVNLQDVVIRPGAAITVSYNVVVNCPVF